MLDTPLIILVVVLALPSTLSTASTIRPTPSPPASRRGPSAGHRHHGVGLLKLRRRYDFYGRRQDHRRRHRHVAGHDQRAGHRRRPRRRYRLEPADLVVRHALQLVPRPHRRHDRRRRLFRRHGGPQRLGHHQDFPVPHPVARYGHRRRLYHHEHPVRRLPQLQAG